MYATGYGIRPLRSSRPSGRAAAGRGLAILVVGVAASVALAVVAHGGSVAAAPKVVVQPGDTLWSIAATHYPADDVRARVEQIEQLNGLRGPLIEAGETLHLPG